MSFSGGKGEKRLIVSAQGVTVLAMVIGAFYLGEKTVEARQVIRKFQPIHRKKGRGETTGEVAR